MIRLYSIEDFYVEVWYKTSTNKIDRVEGALPHIEYDEMGRPIKIWISAQTGEGLSLVREVLLDFFGGGLIRRRLHLTPLEGDLRAGLYRHAFVLSRPDQHVAWRGDCIPQDPLALIDLVRGAHIV